MIPDNLLKSWNTEPFIDIIVVDIDSASDSSQGCPETHPEDVVYDIWPGTVQVCDCLEDEYKRQLYRDITCEKNGMKDYPDCHDLGGQPPIV